MSRISDEDFFERLSTEKESIQTGGLRAPSRLKSKLYSTLIRHEQESGPLQSVSQTRAEGHELCVFENVARISPLGKGFHSFNFCSLCHARILGESLEHAPIFWEHCPYVSFQNR